MPIPYASLSSRSEIKDLLTYAERTLESLTHLDGLRTQRPPMDFQIAAKRVNEISVRYEEPLRLAVVGEFKAGKSALINALLGRPRLVAEGATPTTGTITEIWWSETEEGEVIDSGGNTIFAGTVETTVRYADQRTEEGKKINGKGARVILRINSDFLKNLVILDTPGLGANARDDKVTLDSLHLADAAILVVNGLQLGGGEDSLVIAERLRTSKRKFITVITRMDLFNNPTDAVDAIEVVKSVFDGVSDGVPIGVIPPEVIKGLERLKVADNARDIEGIKSSNEALRAAGYFALRERLQEGWLFDSGQAAGDRVTRTITDLRSLVHKLEVASAQEAGVAEQDAEKIATQLSDSHRIINEVLRPKIPFLESKVDEIVDIRIAEFLADLAEAVDVFIDRMSDSKIELGIRSIAAKFSQREQQRLELHIRDEFRDVFSDDQLGITIEQISHSIRRLMELEWRDIAMQTLPKDVRSFDPSGIVRQVGNHVALVAGAIATEVTATFMLLLFAASGGILVGIAVLVLSFGMGAYELGKESGRVARIKRETKVRLRALRRQLVHRIANHFWTINQQTADNIIASIEETVSGKDLERLNCLRRAEQWRSATETMRRLLVEAEELTSGATMS